MFDRSSVSVKIVHNEETFIQRYLSDLGGLRVRVAMFIHENFVVAATGCGSVRHPAESMASYNGHNARKIQIFWVGRISRHNAPLCQHSQCVFPRTRF